MENFIFCAVSIVLNGIWVVQYVIVITWCTLTFAEVCKFLNFYTTILHWKNIAQELLLFHLICSIAPDHLFYLKKNQTKEMKNKKKFLVEPSNKR